MPQMKPIYEGLAKSTLDRDLKKSSMRFSIKHLLLIATVATISAASSRESFRFVSDSTLDRYKKAAVVTNGPECAQIGSDILELKNGSAVDAAIAALLCEGVASLHSMGLGGGFLMTIYDAPSGEATFLNARETAPGGAHSTMFRRNKTLAYRGGLSVAVPGELMGYWEAHQKYGRVPWKELFEPTIKLCETGSIITKYLENNLKYLEKDIRAEPSLSEILIDPDTNRLYGEGDRIKRPKLASTLRELADSKNPVDLFYKGRIAKQLTDEIKSLGGIITAADFSSYKVKWTSPVAVNLGEMTVYSAPPPGSGALLAFMLNILKDLVPAENDNILWQRIVETYKWAFAKRTELADPDFVEMDGLIANLTSSDYASTIRSLVKDDETHSDPEYYGALTANKDDGGTAHISVLAPDGSAVSVTSSINFLFGIKVRSRSTGIIFNDQMDDFNVPDNGSIFDLPPSPNNFIEPFKRPLSSMSPTIVVDEDGKVALIIGAAGGSKITSTLTSIMALYLWNNYDIKEAIDARRLHHRLLPMTIQRELGFPQDVLNHLEKIGHSYQPFSGPTGTVTAIAVKNGSITANADYRRRGKTAGF